MLIYSLVYRYSLSLSHLPSPLSLSLHSLSLSLSIPISPFLPPRPKIWISYHGNIEIHADNIVRLIPRSVCLWTWLLLLLMPFNSNVPHIIFAYILKIKCHVKYLLNAYSIHVSLVTETCLKCKVADGNTNSNFYLLIALLIHSIWMSLGLKCKKKKRSLFCSPRLHLFDQKYSTNSNIVKCYYILK